jgi:hypothetical protein
MKVSTGVVTFGLDFLLGIRELLWGREDVSSPLSDVERHIFFPRYSHTWELGPAFGA